MHAFIEHFRAHAVHFVDKFGDGLGVAGIMRELMTTVSPLRISSWRWPPSTMRERAESGSPCAPGDHQHNLVVGQVGHAVVGVEEGGRQFGNAQVAGHFNIVGQRFAADDHGAAVGAGQVKNFLNALNVAGKERDDNAPLRRGKDVVQRIFDFALVSDRPSRMALVESESSRRAPSGPAKSRNSRKSVPLPLRGWGSILKSPLCTTRPTGVSTPRPKPSGME